MSDIEQDPPSDVSAEDDPPREAPPSDVSAEDAEVNAAPEGLVLNEMQSAAKDDSADHGEKKADDLEAVFDVPVRVSAVLGKTKIPISDLLNLDNGTVLELDKQVGEPIDIYINSRLVARGEVVLLEEKLGVTMTEIIKAS